MPRSTLLPVRPLVAAMLCIASFGSHAALFEDSEARRAILELRQRSDALASANQRLEQDVKRFADDSSQLRRSLLELQQQIESLRGEQAEARGQSEQVQRDLGDVQRRQKDLAAGLDERLRQFEPAKVNVDGAEVMADPSEKRDYDSALAAFKSANFSAAQSGFTEFLKRHPNSGMRPSALFWLGNAQYANRAYREAIDQFKALLSVAPDHPRAPEAALSIANCQVELKDLRAARKTLEDLTRAYPQSEAAGAARERLARMK